MKHSKVDFDKIEVIEALYHRTYQTSPDAILNVTINGEKKDLPIRRRAAKRDRLYHSVGLPCLLVMYRGFVIAYEIIKDASPNTRLNMVKLIELVADDEDWYFDNEKFYQLIHPKLVPSNDTSMLRIVPLNVIDPIHLTFNNSIDVVEHDCFIVVKDNNIIVQSPPIASVLEKRNKKYLITDTNQDLMYLNLTSLLKLCTTVSRIYGSPSIEVFDIPQYMIRHKTVNLAKLPQHVRDNSSTNLKPYEVILYIMGLIHREDSVENCMKLVKLMRNLTVFGFVNITSSLRENVYTDTPIVIRPLKINRPD